MAELMTLGQERRLIFQNAINGVPMEQIMATFRRSELEVEKDIAFVCRKIREYRFRRRMPPLECDTPRDRAWNRRALLETVEKLGPEYLTSDLILPKIGVQKLNDPLVIKKASEHIQYARTQMRRQA